MKPLKLEQETRELFERIRTRDEQLSVNDLDPDLAEQAVWEIGRLLLDDAGQRRITYNQYRWFLRELAKLLRLKLSWDLAFELELALRKWVNYGLDSRLLQALICECYDRLTVPEVQNEKSEPADTG